MQTTKKIVSLVILGAFYIDASINEIPNTVLPTQSNAFQEVASVLIRQAFSLLVPLDGSFPSAQAAFEKFTKEKKSDRVLSTAAGFFANEADYCNALGAYAELQKFPFLAALFYNQATEYSIISKSDLSERVKLLGVSTVVHMLNSLDIQNGFVQNPKELFSKKDKNGKTPIDLANDVFRLAGAGFKTRAEFVKAVYEYQQTVGGHSHVVQMFGDCFVHGK